MYKYKFNQKPARF